MTHVRLLLVTLLAGVLTLGSAPAVHAADPTTVRVRITAGGAPERGVQAFASNGSHFVYLGVSGSDGQVRPDRLSSPVDFFREMLYGGKLAPGAWRLVFVDRAREHAITSRAVTLTAGRNTVADVDLSPASIVRGRVVTPSGVPIKNLEMIGLPAGEKVSQAIDLFGPAHIEGYWYTSTTSKGIYTLRGLGAERLRLLPGLERLRDALALGVVADVRTPGTLVTMPDLVTRVPAAVELYDMSMAEGRRWTRVTLGLVLDSRYYGVMKPGGHLELWAGGKRVQRVKATGRYQQLTTRLASPSSALRVVYTGSKDVSPAQSGRLSFGIDEDDYEDYGLGPASGRRALR